MRLCFVSILIVSLWNSCVGMERLRGGVVEKPHYFSTSSVRDLGWENPEAATGNPMKGLLGSPSFSDYDYDITSIDTSLEFFYVGLNECMFADPDKDPENAFDWSYIERALELSASANRHAVLTFNVIYPGKPSNLPQYLIDDGLTMRFYNNSGIGSGYTPDFGDPLILKAFRQFIAALGKRYDGDKRIAFIHLGLLGYWGEWHTYPDDGWVPEHAKLSVGQWYADAFKTTKLQGRYPAQPLYDAGFGLYDGSFAYHTLDGDANGGKYRPGWYFWPLVQQAGHDDFWRFAPMGGETRPELQKEIFDPSYKAGTYEKQDFIRSAYTTHATYIFHHDAFNWGGYTGETLANARRAHHRLGYNFLITKIAAAESSDDDGFVDIDVSVRQIGVAPFYYDLNLLLDCDELGMPRSLGGVESLIEDMETATFTFTRIPATTGCLKDVRITMDSSYAYPGRPIRFAQGHDGNIALTIPQPIGAVSVDHIIDEPTGILDSFWLVSVSGRDYTMLRPLNNGDVIDLATVRGDWTVQAHVKDATLADTVTFRFAGKAHRVSRNPFVLESDVMGHSDDPSGFLSTPGNKTIAATIFNYDQEVTGIGKIHFTIIDSSAPQPTATPRPQFSSTSVTLGDAHGFNTAATPTIQEMENEGLVPEQKSGKAAGIVAGILVPLSLLAILAVFVRFFYFQKKKRRGDALDSDSDSDDDSDKDADETTPGSDPGSS